MYQVGERIIYGGSGVCEVRAVGPPPPTEAQSSDKEWAI